MKCSLPIFSLFSEVVGRLDSPTEVLDALHEAIQAPSKLAVMSAALLPLKIGDLDSLELDKIVFLHRSVPKSLWYDFIGLARRHLPAPGMLGYVALGSFTMTEAMQQLDLLAIDRWPIELAHKYGQRDRLMCPVGGR